MSSRDWSATAFPLALLLTLAALTVWLRHAVELPAGSDGRHRHDPDQIIEGARISSIDEQGRLHYTMRAARIVHFPDDDSTDVTQLHVAYVASDRPPTSLTAPRARISADGEEVLLSDEVEIRRAATNKDPPLLAKMRDLHLFVDDERASTDSAVEITQGASSIRGVGLDLDNQARTITLKSKVRAELAPKRAKNRP